VAAVKRVLVAGAVLLGAAWALAPAASPPLYDGLQGPAQAYLYLTPPAGYQQTGRPEPGTGSLAVAQGSSGAGFVNTGETPPQCQALVQQGAFSFPAGATSISLALTPVPPPVPVPASLGVAAGNVYHVAATANVPGAVALVAGKPMTVVLRGPAGVGNAPIARLDEGGTTWQRVTTVPLGSTADMVVSNTDRLGYFVITTNGTQGSPGGSGSGSGSGGPGSGGSGSGGFPVAAVVIAAVVLVAVLAGLWALSARRRQPPPPPARRRR
jgi:hypothetical protein